MLESLAVAVKVLADWRVIAAAAGSLAVWALLRYVGLVYRKPKPLIARKAPKAKPAPAPKPATAPDEGEEMVE